MSEWNQGMHAVVLSKSPDDADKVEEIKIFPTKAEAEDWLLSQRHHLRPEFGLGAWELRDGSGASLVQIHRPGGSMMDGDFQFVHSEAGKRNRAKIEARAKAWVLGEISPSIEYEPCPDTPWLVLDAGTEVAGATWILHTRHGCVGRDDHGKQYAGCIQDVVGPFRDLHAAEKFLLSLKWTLTERGWEQGFAEYPDGCDDIRAVVLQET